LQATAKEATESGDIADVAQSPIECRQYRFLRAASLSLSGFGADRRLIKARIRCKGWVGMTVPTA
jgi:hypothetical protein